MLYLVQIDNDYVHVMNIMLIYGHQIAPIVDEYVCIP